MNPLLDDASVAQGILSITRRDGAPAVTARSLASELHVSLGALYNYTTSMLDAMKNADEHVYTAMAEAIASPDQTPRDALWAWAQPELPLVDLIADLTRSHAPLPLSFLDLVPETQTELPRTTQTAEIARSFVGLWRAGSPDLSTADLETVTDLLTTSLASYDPDASHPEAIVPKESLRGIALDRIAARPHARIDDAVRAASVEVLLEGEWSFRKLQGKTDLPLARLNRMSPRDEHVMTAVADIVGGIVLQHLADNRSVIESMRGIVTTVAANAPLLIGTQLSFLSLSLVETMCNESGLLANEQLDPHQVLLTCGLATAVLHAGYTNREADPAAEAAAVALTLHIAEQGYHRLTA